MSSDQTPTDGSAVLGYVRDLHPSHVYRLGVGIFKSQPIRRRVVEASLFSPPHKAPHAELMRRTLDGKDEKTTRHSPLLPPEMPPAQPQSLAGSDVRTFTEEDYHRWVESRRSMRACLEGAGLTKRWLHSKDRSELEGAVLARLLDAERCQPVMESAAESKPCDQVSCNWSSYWLAQWIHLHHCETALSFFCDPTFLFFFLGGGGGGGGGAGN